MPGSELMQLVPAFDHLHYVPVLYARSAEFAAVATLSPQGREHLTPLWVIPPIALDPASGVPKKSLEQHSIDVATKLAKSWGDQGAFVDVHHLRNERTEGGASPATLVLRSLHDAGLHLVPVLRDDASTAELESLVAFAAEAGTESAIRLSAPVWADLGSPTADAALGALVRVSGSAEQRLHLIIDLGDQVSSPPNMSAAAVKGAIAELERQDEWLTITVLGTSMPATTADVGRDSVAEIPRSEWAMWKLLRATKRRRLSFGDYVVQSVDVLSTFNPLYMQVAAQFRYTISTSWFVVRGSSTKTGGFAQAHKLAATILGHPEFSGRDFSAGDRWIEDCANRATSSGNAQTWRTATTSHHLELVANQLATLRGA